MGGRSVCLVTLAILCSAVLVAPRKPTYKYTIERWNFENSHPQNSQSSFSVSLPRMQRKGECTSPKTMNLDIADAAVNAAIQKANQLGKKFCVTVLDTGVQLVTFSRMDGAILGSIDVSMKKAKTSALFGVESSVLGAISQPGGPAYGAEQTNGGLVGFGGGVPLKSGSGDMIGAIGVSGGTVAEDEEVARAAAEVISQKY